MNKEQLHQYKELSTERTILLGLLLKSEDRFDFIHYMEKLDEVLDKMDRLVGAK